jgi:dipeptidyl aminopeptidase/acylaminoacyl peptidase
VFVVEGPTGGLRLLDFDSARFGALRARPDSSYTWRPGSGIAERWLTIRRAASRAVVALDWRDSTGARGSLPRSKSYPFDHRVVRFRAADSVTLAGVVLLPRVRKLVGKLGGPLREVPLKLPAAVMIHGSGTSDRDNIWAYQFAAHLARTGFVVLLPDKRGSGASGGRWQTADFDVLAADALAAVAVLKQELGVDSARIGAVGLSQGGWIAPLAAGRGKLAFAVNISGAAVTPYEQFIHEVTQDLRAARPSDADVQRVLSLVRLNQAYTRTLSPNAWNDYVRYRTELAAGPLAKVVAASPADSSNEQLRWWHEVGDYDPQPWWRDLAATPVLVIYGANDERDNVPVEQSIRNLNESLAPARNPMHVVRVFPELGHTLTDPVTGGVHRDVFDLIASFLTQAVK